MVSVRPSPRSRTLTDAGTSRADSGSRVAVTWTRSSSTGAVCADASGDANNKARQAGRRIGRWWSTAE
jgi:hypothetical protein